jgi:histone deacetylase 6
MDAMDAMEVQINGETMEPAQTGSSGTEILSLQVNGEPPVPTAELHMQNEGEYDPYLSDYDPQQDLPMASTGYVYDTRMLDHWPTIEPDEDDLPHPEQPARISMIYSALRTAMCFKKMRKISTRSLEKYEAMLIHSEDHWDKVDAIACEWMTCRNSSKP